MTTTEKNPAREEYFVQISELCANYFRTESLTLKRKCKDKVLGISYDANVALQKRVEELEAALRQFVNQSDEVGVSGCTFGDTNYDSESVAYGYSNCLEIFRPTFQQLLTKQS